MLSDTIIFYILIIMLIYCFGSKLIPQIMIFVIIVYNLYTKVITTFEPQDVIVTAITILYCLAHIVESTEKPNKEDD